jgi:hypothetical protein
LCKVSTLKGKLSLSACILTKQWKKEKEKEKEKDLTSSNYTKYSY